YHRRRVRKAPRLPSAHLAHRLERTRRGATMRRASPPRWFSGGAARFRVHGSSHRPTPLERDPGRRRPPATDASTEHDMRLHEYQAKELLARYGVPVPKGRAARTPDDAAAIAEELGKVVVKAQAHTGG